MKKLALFLAGAFALVALSSCNDEKEDTTPEINERQNEEACAAQATVTSSDSNFTATDNGGTISFKTEGGTVTLNVSCGCNWLAENNASDLFPSSMTSNSLTVTAEQNTVENDLTGTITLMTETYRINFATISITQSAYGAPEITVETTEWAAPAKGALTTEIAVTASADWTAEAADAWLTVNKSSTGITLTAAENEDNKERSTKVTLTCTDEIRTAYEYVTVTQDAMVYITLEKESVSFGMDGGEASVAVESNYDWDYSYDSTNGWLTVSKGNDGLKVTVTANEGDAREEVVTVTAGDGAENVVEAQLKVSEAAYVAANTSMILTYNIASANTSTKLPLYGEVDCTVDWGDGTVENITDVQPSHTYTAAGKYDITIDGTVTALYSNGISTSTSPLPITAVKSWGNTGLTDLTRAFCYCNQLTELPEDSGDSFAEVTTVEYMFLYCTTLEGVPEGLFANSPNVKSGKRLFCDCESLKSVPAGLFDDWAEVTDFYGVFEDCYSLTSLPEGLFDKNTKVSDFDGAFYFCTSLEKVPEGLFDNCPLCDDMAYLFYGCTKLAAIPERLFASCSVATDFSYAFYGCSGLKTIGKDAFANCSKVTTFRSLFYNCSALEDIPSGLFDDCAAVTNFQFVFYGCSYLVEIPTGLFNNCPKVTTFYGAFYQCSGITEIPDHLFDYNTAVTTFAWTFYRTTIGAVPDGLFDYCTKVTTFYDTFYMCSSLTSIPDDLFDNCPEVTSFYCTFYNAKLPYLASTMFSKNLKATEFDYTFYGNSTLTGESPYDEIDGVHVHLYDRSNYPDIYATPATYNNCFYSCSGLSDYSTIPSTWGGGGKTSSISAKELPVEETSEPFEDLAKARSLTKM